jgi:hypothetical protein
MPLYKKLGYTQRLHNSTEKDLVERLLDGILARIYNQLT